MPRARLPARLYFRRDEGQWVIRDGDLMLRTGHGLGDREAAEGALQAYLAAKRPAGRGGPVQPHEMTVGEVLALYGADKGPEMKGRETLANNIAMLADFWGNLTCDEVVGSKCRAYEKHRAKPRTNEKGQTFTAGPSTVRRELGVLQSALNYARKERRLLYAPEVTLAKAAPPRDRWLTLGEAARLLRAASPHCRRFILLSLYSGRRMTAVLNLTWDRVDLDANVIRFRQDGELETNKRKGEMQIPRQLAGHLRRWKAAARPGETHVVWFRGRPVGSIKTAMRRAVVRAGLPEEITRHDLKHTAITWAMMRGIRIEAAAEFFDTSPKTIRAHYWHHSPHHQAEGVAAMERK